MCAMIISAAPKQGRMYSSWPAPRLIRWRRFRMLTQRELAAKAGVDVATIVRAEHGAALQYGTLRKLAKALRCRIADLLLGPEPDHNDDH
jgi:transcriptional regulator with XRE-family HTH domain